MIHPVAVMLVIIVWPLSVYFIIPTLVDWTYSAISFFSEHDMGIMVSAANSFMGLLESEGLFVLLLCMLLVVGWYAIGFATGVFKLKGS